jgi:hypothetical protein
MSRPVAFCAGFLLVAVGCIPDTFLSRSTGSARYTRVVDGPPARVASVLEAGFSGSGIAVLVKHEDGEFRLVGQTKSGQVFCFYVRSDKAPTKSTVSVHWDAQPDEDLWETVVQWLATFTPPRDDAPKGS